MTVSFYIKNDALSTDKIKSHIKFGSMDTINLKNKRGIFIFRTINKTTWNLKCTEFALGLNRIREDIELSFEP